MGIAIEKLFAQLLFWLYDFLDAIFQTFQVLAGITPVDVNGDSMSLINVFLMHSTVTQVFLSIFLLSIIVVAICAIAKVVATVINVKGGERKSHAKTVGQALAVIPTTLVMAVVLIMFIFVSNSMLLFVQKSFNSSYENLTFSQMLFDMSVESSYRYDYNNPTYVPTYVIGADGRPIQVIDKETGLPAEDENGEPILEVQRDVNGNIIYEAVYDILKDADGNPLLSSGWQVKGGTTVDDYIYYNAADLDFSKMNPDTIFGVHKKTLGLFEDGSKEYTQKAIVEMESFNLMTAYLVAVIMLVVIIWSMLGLVKRIFDITFLFLALPLVSATIPLDDGAKFKTWRDTVISKIILAFGVVFSINIFLLMLPIIQQIDFVALGWSAGIATVFKIFLMMGGALSINGGQLLAARLVGADASESREMSQAARALLGGTMAAGGLLRGAKNLAFGGQNKYGRQVGGVLPAAAKLGGGAANLLGNAMGGAAYRSGMNKSKAAVGNVANALRGITKINSSGATGSPGTVGGRNAPTATEKKSGLFHNGLIGAIGKTTEARNAKTPMGSHLLTPLGKPTVTPSNENNNSGSSQNYQKPDDKTGIDNMINKLSVLPNKNDGSGAMKKPPKK